MKAEIIIDLVSDYFGIPAMVMELKDRHKEIIKPRQIAMYFCKEFKAGTLQHIGWLLGGKDHCTVLHAIKTVNNRIDTERQYRDDIEYLRERIKLLLPQPAGVVEDMFMENDYYQN